MSLVKVEFEWDDRFGPCYDCGRPAAYVVGHEFDGTTPEARLRCSVDAAMAAYEGENIVWLFADEYAPFDAAKIEAAEPAYDSDGNLT